MVRQVQEQSRTDNIPGNGEKKLPSIDEAGLLSVITCSWMSKLMYKAYRGGITVDNLPNVSPKDTGICNANRLEQVWKEELAKIGPKQNSFQLVAWRFCQWRVIASCLIFSCSTISGCLSSTLFMRNILEYVESGNGSYSEGAMWVSALVASETVRSLLRAWSMAINYRTALRLRSACLTLLYKKIIRVNNLGKKNIGQAINMFTNDAQRIYDAIIFGPSIVGAPISTLFGLVYIQWLLGSMAFLGTVAFLLFFLLQYLLSRLAMHMQTKVVQISDMRVRMMSEILDCMKLIKMYAWEKFFDRELSQIRKKERRVLLKNSYCQNFGEAIAPAVPIISSSITFLAHVSMGKNLRAAQVFSISALLESGIRTSLGHFQDGVEAIVSAVVSFARMQELLLMDEGNCQISKPVLESHAVVITRGIFGYRNISDDDDDDGKSGADDGKRQKVHKSEGKYEIEKPNKPTSYADQINVLFDVSFEAEKGKLIGICGRVGSGKSSLLLAALGQLRVSQGQVTRDGSCAYVSQQAWIINATLRENILFGAKYDYSRYQKTIYACSLSQDIDTMPGGDRAEIGERGVNLSGGQKQRVALARALYADRDIYLLDDPLSAVDAHVGSHIFDNLILGALRGKTVLFVTHQIQYLNRCDDIYMMRDGRIIARGTHDELIKLGGEYASMVAANSSAENETEDEPIREGKIDTFSKSFEDIPIPDSVTRNRTAAGGNVEECNDPDAELTVAENLEQGAVKASTYHSYVTAAGGYISSLAGILVFLSVQASIAFNPWWLANWIEAGGGNTTIVKDNVTIFSDNIIDNPDFAHYQTIYSGSVGVLLLACVIRTFVYTKLTIRASTSVHNRLFKKILDSPMRFFDTTPTGRIQHLFSRDMDEVDNRLPLMLSRFLEMSVEILLAILVICIVFPWFVLPACVLTALFYFICTVFRFALRDLKRMDNKARAPVISWVTTTVQGLGTIRAFGKENDFVAKFAQLFDENCNCLFIYTASTEWLATRIDALSTAVLGMTAALVVLLQGRITPAMAGLVVAYSSQISGSLAYHIFLLSETEIRFISLERIYHYMSILTREGSEKRVTVEPSSTWPVSARMKFSNVSMAYGKGAPLILKDVSFGIGAGEKIGIVGRTGSGKSSLAVALFRLAELAEGRIDIDDVDISKVSLDQLRNRMSIIPQDPVLFSGTIRSNLDPSKLHTDDEVWKVLEKTELKTRVRSLTGQLDASVGFGGDTLSLGERQLLCLSRALLGNSKILVLDEATAAVDRKTEFAIQKTIQKEFSDCTVLTIAHRLKTVISLDRILVMDEGRVLEFDTPSNLLENQSSEFSRMSAAAEKAES